MTFSGISRRILDQDKKDFSFPLPAFFPLARVVYSIVNGQLTSRDLYTCVKSKKRKKKGLARLFDARVY